MSVVDEPHGPPWREPLSTARGQIFVFFFFAAFIFLLYQLYRVVSFFLVPIIWAAILAMLFYPVYEVVLRRVRGRSTPASLILTTIVATLIVVPTLTLSSIVTQESASLYARMSQYVRSGQLQETLDDLRDSRPGRLVERLGDQGWTIDYKAVLQRVGAVASQQATALARNVAGVVFDFTIMIFTLFFVFRDGDRMYRMLHDVIPMHGDHKDVIFQRLYETLSAVMRGMVATALAQGLLTGVGLWALGIPYPVFLGVLAGTLSFVPFVGAAGVWIPCVIYLALSEHLVRAAVLVGYGSLVISMVDNVLRPLLIGGQTRLPTLFLFFGILGGLQVYGVLGIFLGPVLLAIVVAFVKIYQEQYAPPPETDAVDVVPG